jgi:hypothetical protein
MTASSGVQLYKYSIFLLVYVADLTDLGQMAKPKSSGRVGPTLTEHIIKSHHKNVVAAYFISTLSDLHYEKAQ